MEPKELNNKHARTLAKNGWNLQGYSCFPASGVPLPVLRVQSRHEHCVDVLKPSTFIHVSDKLLQLAATNCTHGGHRNTQANAQ